ncbi:hypothetical protein [Cellulomonas timonensis]|uniref:hypothetical protein n=1 Tax=Cellulomonas timonensis TaxID=1689271 RepID=UPI00082ACF43|nr:hypothetical protein [Cellulomonas timonensis]
MTLGTAIPTSQAVSSTAEVVLTGSEWIITPSRGGVLTARAELDVAQVTAGFGLFGYTIELDGVPVGIGQFFESGITRLGTVLDSWPVRVRAGVPRTLRIRGRVFSSSGAARINASTWRATIS